MRQYAQLFKVCVSALSLSIPFVGAATNTGTGGTTLQDYPDYFRRLAHSYHLSQKLNVDPPLENKAGNIGGIIDQGSQLNQSLDDSSSRPTVGGLPASNASPAPYPGRYGHSAVALHSNTDKSTNSSILFIGGQVTGQGTYITNDVLELDPHQPYSPPGSSSPNPRLVPRYSSGLPPRAWGSVGVDGDGRVWVIGGMVEDCEGDAGAYARLFSSPYSAAAEPLDSTWEAWNPGNDNVAPARRRQARAVVVPRSLTDPPTLSPNNSTDHYLALATSPTGEERDIWVFGGIAEPYTCSTEMVGYLGIDRWATGSPKTTTVSTVRLPDPLVGSLALRNDSLATNTTGVEWTKAMEQEAHPPITDYASSLIGTDLIVVLGGQLTNGSLADLSQAVVFNVTEKAWGVMPIEGSTPPPRMGHTLTRLAPHNHLLYGGLSSDHQPLSTLYTLDTSTNPWRWSTVPSDPTATNGSNASPQPRNFPSRAYHSAVRLSSGEVVVAWGMGEGSNLVSGPEAFWSVRIENGVASWGLMGTDITPKTTPSLSSPSSSSSTTSSVLWTLASATTPAFIRVSSSLETPLPAVPTSSPTATQSSLDSIEVKAAPPSMIVSFPPSPPPISSESSSSKSGNGTPAAGTKVIAGVVTGLFASAALVAGVMMLARHRALNAVAQAEGTAGPPVTMLYTRQLSQRLLRLGSSNSALPGGGAEIPTVVAAAAVGAAMGRRTVSKGWGSTNSRGPPLDDEIYGPPHPMLPKGQGGGTLQRNRTLFEQLKLPGSPFPRRASPSSTGEPTPFTGDGALPSQFRLPRSSLARAPSMRTPTQSRDSGMSQLSDVSVQSYPYLMALMPQRTNSAGSYGSSSSGISSGVRSHSARSAGSYLSGGASIVRANTIGPISQSEPPTAITWLGKLRPKFDFWMWPGGSASPARNVATPLSPQMVAEKMGGDAGPSEEVNGEYNGLSTRVESLGQNVCVSRPDLPAAFQPRRGTRELRCVNLSPQL